MKSVEVIVSGGRDSQTCLEAYLQKDRIKTSRKLRSDIAENDSNQFETSVWGLIEKQKNFLDTSEQNEIAFLVLGKIQSGKTAHLLSQVAWAVQTKIALTVILTGVTGALNNQTVKRVKRDLSTLGDNYVKVKEVPTKSNSEDFRFLANELKRLIARRMNSNIESGFGSPLPILVTLKNPTRVRVLNTLIAELSEKYKENLVLQLIDDETDQASQNSRARRNEISETYAQIAELRNKPCRNILLSYTATPQAVLLTDRFGRLRPDYCYTVSPRYNYFGLEDLTDARYLKNRVEVRDWLLDPMQMKAAPKSLRNCLMEFLISGWVRFNLPHNFYFQSGKTEEQLNNYLKSVQMMIHESGSNAKQRRVYRFVMEELDRLADGLNSVVSRELNTRDIASITSEWQTRYDSVVERSGNSIRNLGNFLNEETAFELLELLENRRVLVVNSDPNRPNPDYEIPVEDDEWEEFKIWILVGGDILGRGLTIPQLITTYFTRFARTPNFDTVSQQMRFCGYRAEYSNLTSIFALPNIFSAFLSMQRIEQVLWRRAQTWQRESLNIRKNMPSVFYVSDSTDPMNPTRRNVQDSQIYVRNVDSNSEIITSSKFIFHPTLVKENLSIISTFLQENSESARRSESYLLFDEPSDFTMMKILGSWDCKKDEYSNFRGAAELFEPEMMELGLSQRPRTIVISELVIEAANLEYNQNRSQSWIDKIDIKRSTTRVAKEINLELWRECFKSPGKKRGSWSWPKLETPHIGGGQRALRRRFGLESHSVLLIEFIKGEAPGRSRSKVCAIGLAITLLSPKNFSIRQIGHSSNQF